MVSLLKDTSELCQLLHGCLLHSATTRKPNNQFVLADVGCWNPGYCHWTGQSCVKSKFERKIFKGIFQFKFRFWNAFIFNCLMRPLAKASTESSNSGCVQIHHQSILKYWIFLINFSFFKSASCQSMLMEERDLIWKFRFWLKSNQKALAKFVRSVNWQEELEVRQVIQVLFSKYSNLSLNFKLMINYWANIARMANGSNPINFKILNLFSI